MALLLCDNMKYVIVTTLAILIYIFETRRRLGIFFPEQAFRILNWLCIVVYVLYVWSNQKAQKLYMIASVWLVGVVVSVQGLPRQGLRILR